MNQAFLWKGIRIKQNFHVSNTYGGEIEMKRIARILTLALIVTCLLSLPTISNWASNSSSGKWNKDKFSRCRAVYWWEFKNTGAYQICWRSSGCECKLGRKYKKSDNNIKRKKVVLQIGNKNYEVNGQQKQMDTVALLKNPELLFQ